VTEPTVPTDHVGIARDYLAKAQSIAEWDLGHGLFTMGAALKHTLDALEGHKHLTDSEGDDPHKTGPALPVQERE
jgi:hypothetical protein